MNKEDWKFIFGIILTTISCLLIYLFAKLNGLSILSQFILLSIIITIIAGYGIIVRGHKYF